MIKIQINNIQQKRQEYENALTDLVAYRISVLQQSLSHLNGIVINFGTGDFRSFKAVTKEIIEIVGDTINMPNGRNGYSTAINTYRAGANNLGNININGLIQFCNFQLANNKQQLRNLLVADADDLFNLNTTTLNIFAVNTIQNIAAIKLAFNYQKYADIASVIKSYFRANNYAKICPYCNIEPVIHQTNNAAEVVRSLELDHFYDKSRYPLLSYSLFNLIPSDHTCNVTNKGGCEFTDEYHLNPHHMGYSDRINFVPIGLTTAYEVTNIEVRILEIQGSAMYRRINGNNLPAVEQGEFGNLNVFKIRSKYLDKTHIAGLILKTIHKENKYFKHLKKYFRTLSTLDKQNNYINWYEKELNVRFKSTDFNEKAYSKFYRDIHDYYFNTNATRWNRYILELINA